MAKITRKRLMGGSRKNRRTARRQVRRKNRRTRRHSRRVARRVARRHSRKHSRRHRGGYRSQPGVMPSKDNKLLSAKDLNQITDRDPFAWELENKSMDETSPRHPPSPPSKNNPPPPQTQNYVKKDKTPDPKK